MIITILTIVALWKLFSKAGEAGWKCLIPVYNIYTLYQIARNDGFVKMIILTIVEGVCFAAGAGLVLAGTMGSILLLVFGVLAYIIGIVACILLLIVQYKMYADLAQSFGHERGFAWGLLLLTPIFIWIIGLGSDTYGGQVSYGNTMGGMDMGMPMTPNMANQNLQQPSGAYMPPQYHDNQQDDSEKNF